MIDLFFWTTPNGYQATILLKELGWDGSTTPETRARRASGLAALKDTLGRNCEKPSGAGPCGAMGRRQCRARKSLSAPEMAWGATESARAMAPAATSTKRTLAPRTPAETRIMVRAG